MANLLILFSQGSDSDVRLMLIRDICTGPDECLGALQKIHERFRNSDDQLTEDEEEAHDFLAAMRHHELPVVRSDGKPSCGCQDRLVELEASNIHKQWPGEQIDFIIRTGDFG